MFFQVSPPGVMLGGFFKINFMGSFNSTCFVTNQTIRYGDPVSIQFLVPSMLSSQELIDMEANFMSDDERSVQHKGLAFVNSFKEWVPFGPFIEGIYDDHGTVMPLNVDYNMQLVKDLEDLIGLPFNTIQRIANDHKWFTLGIQEGKQTWLLPGVDKSLSEWQLELCKSLVVTHFHAGVPFDDDEFSVEEEDMPLDVHEALKKDVELFTRNMSEVFKDHNHKCWMDNYYQFIHYMDSRFKEQYLTKLSTVNWIEWLPGMYVFYRNLMQMGVVLRRSTYSEYDNTAGWKRTYKSIKDKNYVGRLF